MKNILFSLVALVCSMSMNAQTMNVMKNGELVAKYRGADYSVVFEKKLDQTIGTAKRSDGIDVKWVQLWGGGPRFAEYNIGADSETEYGGYYCYGGSINKDRESRHFSTQGVDLPGEYDTATNVWGIDWRMPTNQEFRDLIKNCDVEWTENYKESGLNGCIVTGKGDYVSNSVFFPASGWWRGGNQIDSQNVAGYYWSSSASVDSNAHQLRVYKYGADMTGAYRDRSFSVRAVLAE